MAGAVIISTMCYKLEMKDNRNHNDKFMKYSERYYQTYLNQILMKVLLDILVMCLSTIPFNKHFHTLQSIDIENNNIFLSAS